MTFVRKGPFIAGVGWILSGIVSFIAYFAIAQHRICNCPMIPANATPSEIASICHCLGAPYGLLAVGAVAVAVGVAVLVFNKPIGRMLIRIRKR